MNRLYVGRPNDFSCEAGERHILKKQVEAIEYGDSDKEINVECQYCYICEKVFVDPNRVKVIEEITNFKLAYPNEEELLEVKQDLHPKPNKSVEKSNKNKQRKINKSKQKQNKKRNKNIMITYYCGNPKHFACKDNGKHRLFSGDSTISGHVKSDITYKKIRKEKLHVPVHYCEVCGKKFISRVTASSITAHFGNSINIIRSKEKDIDNPISINKQPVNKIEKLQKNVIQINKAPHRKITKPVIKVPLENQRQVQICHADFLTRCNVAPCISNGHKIEHIRAYVNVVDPNGEVVETMAPAMYCANCKKYYILEREFKSLQKRGLILCKIVDTSYWSNDKKYDGFLSPESMLHILGYNVGAHDNLSKYQRWTLLERIVDYKLLTKENIVNHIEMLINLNDGRAIMSDAVQKWKDDRRHILNYKSSGNRLVKIDSVKRRVKK